MKLYPTITEADQKKPKTGEGRELSAADAEAAEDKSAVKAAEAVGVMPEDEAALSFLQDYENAVKIASVRIGEKAFYYRKNLRHYYLPYSRIGRVFRRIYAVPVKMCCGYGDINLERMVFLGKDGKQLLEVELPSKGEAESAFEKLKARLPEVDFTVPKSLQKQRARELDELKKQRRASVIRH